MSDFEAPYDYWREAREARKADKRDYPEPGQWVGGEWHAFDPADEVER